MAEPPPQRIGKYDVVKELGRGTAGVVYLARDAFAGRDVAIKAFTQTGAAGLQGRYRSLFLNEAALVGKLSHPHIVQLLDVSVEESFSYIVMEYVGGKTLAHHTTAEHFLMPEKVVEVIFKVSRALEYMHRHGVIHRDIKPANILVTDDFDVKVADFGIAVLADATRTNLINVGSPAFMSPEQLQEQPLTHQTDIYSLGVVLYNLLTGRLPFAGSSYASLIYQIIHHEAPRLSTIRPDLPPGFEQIVVRALKKDLASRYQSWGEFGADLAVLVRNVGVNTPREDPTDTRKFNAMKDLTFFQGFKEVEVWEALRIASWRNLPAGATLIKEGDRGDAIFILVEGEAGVARAGKVLATLVPGDCYGEMLYFAEKTSARTTTIVATKPVLVIEIKAAALSSSSDGCQVAFNKSFMRLLIERLTTANRKLSEQY